MIYLNLGRRELGKTTLALYLVRTMPARVYFDPRGLLPATGTRVTLPDDVGPAFDQLWERVQRQGDGELTFTPRGNVQRFFDLVCAQMQRWIEEPNAPRIAFLVDELRFVNTDGDAFDWVMRCAPRSDVTIVGTAHRPVDVSVHMRAIADVWCVFQMSQEHDLKVLSEKSPALALKAARLHPREFVAWDDTTATLTEYHDPRLWYVPLAAERMTAVHGLDLPASAPRVDRGKLFE